MKNELNQVHKTKRIYQLFEQFYLVVFDMQRSYHEEISEKKTITGSDDSENSYCTSKNVIQDNGNINNFWKGSRWFCHQCLGTFCCFLRPELRKWLFGKLHLCPSI